ncbi:hypothetical protein RhiirB3_472343 [Rhizophagus irregularis]|nr:hypothetical protein RhiirB3_472343 [Rhizophagus irregularis]
MSDIYERINKLGLEQEEIIKIKSYLVRSKEIREQLLLALASCKSEEEEKGVIWNLLHSGLTVTATNENDNMTYKTLPSWQKTKYDRLADESLKALYLETIREEREKSELNLDIIKVALISLVNISMDVLNKSHNDDESIKIFMLILNAVVDGIQLLVIILKIVRIAIYWVDAGLSCSELLLKIDDAEKNGDRTNRDLVRFCFRFGKALSERLAILLQSNPPQRKQRIQSLTINKEVKDKLPENANNGMVRKRTDTARKIFDIFSVIWEDKILRIKSFTAYSFLDLTRSEVTLLLRHSHVILSPCILVF